MPVKLNSYLLSDNGFQSMQSRIELIEDKRL
jgi:hypothetical protein